MFRKLSAFRPPSGDRLFFSLACLFAAGAVPILALQHAGQMPFFTLAPRLWHAHEMVFGFGLALMGGYFAASLPSRKTAFLLLAWGLGRLAFLVPPPLFAPFVLLAAAYPALLFFLVGRPMLKAAKSWRNSIFGLILASFPILDLAISAAIFRAGDYPAADIFSIGLLPLVAMIYAMGGRITAAATNGALQKQGLHLIKPSQPRLEKLGLGLLLLMMISYGAGLPLLIGSLLALGLAGIIALRLARWRFWKLADPSILALHLGFIWLAAGFALIAAQPLIELVTVADLLHSLTIGALGTLSITIMTRLTLQRSRLPLRLPRLTLLALAAVNLAALLRIPAAQTSHYLPLLLAAAGLWSGAYLIQFAVLLRTSPAPRRRKSQR